MKTNKESLTKLIESIVEEEVSILDEKAKTTSDAENDGLALYIKKDEGIEFVLYEPTALLSVFDGSAHINGTDGPEDVIAGFLRISNVDFEMCDGSWVVTNSAARQGYGPLLYDIAMSFISPQFLTADRDSVSPEAEKVWRVYYARRRSEFNVKPLIQNYNCRNLNSKEPAVNYAFSIKQKLNYSSLTKAHKNLMSKMKGHSTKMENTLIDMGFGFFDLKYKHPS